MRRLSSEELVTWRFRLTSIPKSSVERISNKDLGLQDCRKSKVRNWIKWTVRRYYSSLDNQKQSNATKRSLISHYVNLHHKTVISWLVHYENHYLLFGVR